MYDYNNNNDDDGGDGDGDDHCCCRIVLGSSFVIVGTGNTSVCVCVDSSPCSNNSPALVLLSQHEGTTDIMLLLCSALNAMTCLPCHAMPRHATPRT